MAKQPKAELVIVGFNYELLEAPVADQVRSSTERIRDRVKRTLEDIIGVGQDLLAVKEALPHGQFGPWLAAEFGWTDRTARNFMAVAEKFGPKSEIIADLKIAPTAAYLLAAPSAPDQARQKAIERAEAGETITTDLAKEIILKVKKKAAQRKELDTTEKLAKLLARALERYKERWGQDERAGLAQRLREIADSLEPPQRGGRRKAKE